MGLLRVRVDFVRGSPRKVLLPAVRRHRVGGRPDVALAVRARRDRALLLLPELADLEVAGVGRALALDRVAVLGRLPRALLEEAGGGHAPRVEARGTGGRADLVGL